MNGVSRFLSKRKGKGSSSGVGDGKVSALIDSTFYDSLLGSALDGAGSGSNGKGPPSKRFKLLFITPVVPLDPRAKLSKYAYVAYFSTVH
jgi:hypothetical protein